MVDLPSTVPMACSIGSIGSITQRRHSQGHTILRTGVRLRRLIFGRVCPAPCLLRISPDNSRLTFSTAGSCFVAKFESVPTSELVEVRCGWKSEGFVRAATKESFTERQNEGCCFSIIVRRVGKSRHKNRTIDLIVETSDMLLILIPELHRLIAEQKANLANFNESSWLQKSFREADVNKDGTLSFDEIWRLLQRLGVEVSPKYIKQIIGSVLNLRGSECRSEKEKALRADEFVLFFRALTRREELQTIMRWYSSQDELVFMAEHLKEFLQKEQGMSDVSIEYCRELIEKFEPDIKTRNEHLLTENGFRQLLMSDLFDAVDHKLLQEDQDMTLPLHNYYISSSHNTYLLGGQLRGRATAEGYMNALEKGARLLEIDAWDGPNGEPIVTHGHTLIEPVLLKVIVNAIDRCAFKDCQYPVLVSLENHASTLQQRKMAELFAEIWGAKLLPVFEDEGLGRLPSPAELKGRILLKGKKSTSGRMDTHVMTMLTKPILLPALIETEEDERRGSTNSNVIRIAVGEEPGGGAGGDESGEESDESAVDWNELPAFVLADSDNRGGAGGGVGGVSLDPGGDPELTTQNTLISRIRQQTSEDSDAVSLNEETMKQLETPVPFLTAAVKEVAQEVMKKAVYHDKWRKLHRLRRKAQQSDGAKVVPVGIDQELSNITALRSTGLKNISTLTKEHSFDTFASTSEGNEIAFRRDYPLELIKFTAANILKVYPSGRRTDSSNINPVPRWAYGAQVVAMNMQKQCEEMDLHEGFFMQNKGCGYVLKPECLRDSSFHPRKAARGPVKQILSVKVISGQYIPKPPATDDLKDIVDPYVYVQIFGLECDQNEAETKPVLDNGFNPIWNQEFVFHLRAPELAMIRFSVRDKDVTTSEFVAQFCCPVRLLNKGYVHLRLKTILSSDSGASLFVRIQKKDLCGDDNENLISKAAAVIGGGNPLASARNGTDNAGGGQYNLRRRASNVFAFFGR